jgi:hypothetical protein
MKIGRTSKVQAGQIAGAPDPRVAERIPATSVPCMQATLVANAQVPANPQGSREFASLKNAEGLWRPDHQ